MLVITRRPGAGIVLKTESGEIIRIVVDNGTGSYKRLKVICDPKVRILRDELHDEIVASKKDPWDASLFKKKVKP